MHSKTIAVLVHAKCKILHGPNRVEPWAAFGPRALKCPGLIWMDTLHCVQPEYVSSFLIEMNTLYNVTV